MSETGTTLPRATGVGREDDQRFAIGVYGASGSGKTTWVEEILLAQKKRLLIIDTLCKDYGNPEFCAATGITYDAVVKTVPELYTLLSQKIGKDGKGNFRIVARCPGQEMKILGDLYGFDEARQSSRVTDSTLAIEEIATFMSSQKMPDELHDVIVRSRHSRNNIVGIAQVPTGQTNPVYRSQMSVFVSFRQDEDNAFKFFSDFSEEKAEQLRGLKRGDFFLFKGTPEQLMEFIKTP